MKIVCEERRDEGLRTFRDDCIGTIRTIDGGGDKRVIENTDDINYRIRKLTPKECWRLMGFSDDAFDRAKQAMNEKCYGGKDRSSSQLYKQAGNSIVTDVLYYIFKELYTAMPYLFDDLKVSSYFSGIGAFEVALDRLFADVNGMNQPEPVFRGGRDVIVYDDYNSHVRPDSSTMGTITTNIGSPTPRNGYKLIES